MIGSRVVLAILVATLTLFAQPPDTTQTKTASLAESALQPVRTSIVVTATRSETEPEKSPVSTGYVSRQELQEIGRAHV